MTVLTGDDLYNFALVNSPGQAALSVKLTEGNRRIEQPEPGSIQLATADVQPTLSPVQQLTKQDVVAARPVYHPEKLRTLLELAKEAPLLQESSPELYKGYEERKVTNVSDYGDVIVTVQEVHRFPADDAIVLIGEIQNKSIRPIIFDPAAITIGIGDRQYPSAFVDCAGRVAAEAAIKFAVVGQGDVDGSRAHLALRNTFRIQLPNFQAPAPPSPTPPEASKRPIAKTSLIPEANARGVEPPERYSQTESVSYESEQPVPVALVACASIPVSKSKTHSEERITQWIEIKEKRSF